MTLIKIVLNLTSISNTVIFSDHSGFKATLGVQSATPYSVHPEMTQPKKGEYLSNTNVLIYLSYLGMLY